MRYSKEWLEVEEVQAIFDLEDLPEKYEIWVKLLYTPALRVTEATGIQRKDLNLNRGVIDVWGGKKRAENEAERVPCDKRILRDIIRYCDRHDLRPSDYVMFSNRSSRVSRGQVYRVVNDLARQAGIQKKIGTHTFRRSRATHLLDAGLPLAQVSRFLRHRNLSTTMTYLSISVADIQRDIDACGDPLNQIL